MLALHGRSVARLGLLARAAAAAADAAADLLACLSQNHHFAGFHIVVEEHPPPGPAAGEALVADLLCGPHSVVVRVEIQHAQMVELYCSRCYGLGNHVQELGLLLAPAL